MAICGGVKSCIEKMIDNREALMRDRKEKNEFLFGSNNLNRYDGHTHVVIGDNSKVHYIRDRDNTKKDTDRKNAESYNGGFFEICLGCLHSVFLHHEDNEWIYMNLRDYL